MGYKLITQLVLLVTSLVIIFTFVTPRIGTVSEKQDKVLEYQEILEQVSGLNEQLRTLVATEQSISQNEKLSLNTYIPENIDHIVVMRDIQNIFDAVGLPLISISSGAQGSLTSLASVEGGPQNTGEPGILYRDFNLVFVAEYEDFKRILATIESNAYPLEVIDLNFASVDQVQPEIGESGQMKYSILLRTFALTGVQ